MKLQELIETAISEATGREARFDSYRVAAGGSINDSRIVRKIVHSLEPDPSGSETFEYLVFERQRYAMPVTSRTIDGDQELEGS